MVEVFPCSPVVPEPVVLNLRKPSAMPTNTVALLDEAQCQQLEAFLVERIYEFNVEATGYSDARLLGVSLRDDAGEIIAGCSGHTWGGCCQISSLWVSESRRGQGLGRRLLDTAESEAIRRGCRQVVLLSHSFQAPAFYEQLGFAHAGGVTGYPRGEAFLLMVKPLAD